MVVVVPVAVASVQEWIEQTLAAVDIQSAETETILIQAVSIVLPLVVVRRSLVYPTTARSLVTPTVNRNDTVTSIPDMATGNAKTEGFTASLPSHSASMVTMVETKLLPPADMESSVDIS